jgi:hypothetical protein
MQLKKKVSQPQIRSLIQTIKQKISIEKVSSKNEIFQQKWGNILNLQ